MDAASRCILLRVATRAFVPFRRGRFEDLPQRPRLPHPYFEARVERVPVTMARLGTLAARVRVYGSGPPLLLVHGLMTSSYSWRHVLEPLGTHFTLYAPDLPGAGQRVLGRRRHERGGAEARRRTTTPSIRLGVLFRGLIDPCARSPVHVRVRHRQEHGLAARALIGCDSFGLAARGAQLAPRNRRGLGRLKVCPE
jgi:hypothetical protein